MCSSLARWHRRRNMRPPAAGRCGELRPKGLSSRPAKGSKGCPDKAGDDEGHRHNEGNRRVEGDRWVEGNRRVKRENVRKEGKRQEGGETTN